MGTIDFCGLDMNGLSEDSSEEEYGDKGKYEWSHGRALIHVMRGGVVSLRRTEARRGARTSYDCNAYGT